MNKQKKQKQTTLFQSWQSQTSSTGETSNNGEKGKAKQQKNSLFQSKVGHSSNGDAIDLCLSDEDDELLRALEESRIMYEQTAQMNQAEFVKPYEVPHCSKSSVSAPQKPAASSSNTSLYNQRPTSASSTSFSPDVLPVASAGKAMEDIPGFDNDSGCTWVYPTNYPIRDYQFNIVQKALFNNTLVTLPTGLGKTFVSAVVMYNFYRWYPTGKIVFMAPTKPLVAQQIKACHDIVGIPMDDTAEMTGAMQPSERKKAWSMRRVFYLTPQVMTNDLSRGICPAADIKCLVIDEAHKSLGNHAYCQVVRELVKYSSQFRVVALSATPGPDVKTVQQVLSNLLIAHIELRTEDSLDIQPYIHERKVEKIVIPLGEELSGVRDKYLQIAGAVVERLKRQHVLFCPSVATLAKFTILKARDTFRQNPPQNMQRAAFGIVEGDFAMCISLYHGLELLQLHGLRSLYNYLEGLISSEKGYGRTRTELLRNQDFTDLMDSLRQNYRPVKCANPNTVLPTQPQNTRTSQSAVGHPKMIKLEEIVVDHFLKFKNEGLGETRVIIFSQFRDSVNEITEILSRRRPLVRVMSFIGHSSGAGNVTKGFSERDQLKVMREFRDGGYNTLVSTCVGEEGLDIGDVDLIICFDAHKSPVRMIRELSNLGIRIEKTIIEWMSSVNSFNPNYVLERRTHSRMGRTGRKREGRIVMLVTEGKEEQIYNSCQRQKKSIHKVILSNSKTLIFYQNNPRMVPRGLNPVCHKTPIVVPQYKAHSKSKNSAARPSSVLNATEGADKHTSRDGFLTASELDYWSRNLKLEEKEMPRMPQPQIFVSLKQPSKEVSMNTTTAENLNRSVNPVGRVSNHRTLSLNEWIDWQDRLQTFHHVDHSLESRHLVQLIEFINLQGQTDEDTYELEMNAFLDMDDVIVCDSISHPNSTTVHKSAHGDITKYCSRKKPENVNTAEVNSYNDVASDKRLVENGEPGHSTAARSNHERKRITKKAKKSDTNCMTSEEACDFEERHHVIEISESVTANDVLNRSVVVIEDDKILHNAVQPSTVVCNTDNLNHFDGLNDIIMYDKTDHTPMIRVPTPPSIDGIRKHLELLGTTFQDIEVSTGEIVEKYRKEKLMKEFMYLISDDIEMEPSRGNNDNQCLAESAQKSTNDDENNQQVPKPSAMMLLCDDDYNDRSVTLYDNNIESAGKTAPDVKENLILDESFGNVCNNDPEDNFLDDFPANDFYASHNFSDISRTVSTPKRNRDTISDVKFDDQSPSDVELELNRIETSVSSKKIAEKASNVNPLCDQNVRKTENSFAEPLYPNNSAKSNRVVMNAWGDRNFSSTQTKFTVDNSNNVLDHDDFMEDSDLLLACQTPLTFRNSSLLRSNQKPTTQLTFSQAMDCLHFTAMENSAFNSPTGKVSSHKKGGLFTQNFTTQANENGTTEFTVRAENKQNYNEILHNESLERNSVLKSSKNLCESVGKENIYKRNVLQDADNFVDRSNKCSDSSVVEISNCERSNLVEEQPQFDLLFNMDSSDDSCNSAGKEKDGENNFNVLPENQNDQNINKHGGCDNMNNGDDWNDDFDDDIIPPSPEEPASGTVPSTSSFKSILCASSVSDVDKLNKGSNSDINTGKGLVRTKSFPVGVGVKQPGVLASENLSKFHRKSESYISSQPSKHTTSNITLEKSNCVSSVNEFANNLTGDIDSYKKLSENNTSIGRLNESCANYITNTVNSNITGNIVRNAAKYSEKKTPEIDENFVKPIRDDEMIGEMIEEWDNDETFEDDDEFLVSQKRSDTNRPPIKIQRENINHINLIDNNQLNSKDSSGNISQYRANCTKDGDFNVGISKYNGFIDQCETALKDSTQAVGGKLQLKKSRLCNTKAGNTNSDYMIKSNSAQSSSLANRQASSIISSKALDDTTTENNVTLQKSLIGKNSDNNSLLKPPFASYSNCFVEEHNFDLCLLDSDSDCENDAMVQTQFSKYVNNGDNRNNLSALNAKDTAPKQNTMKDNGGNSLAVMNKNKSTDIMPFSQRIAIVQPTIRTSCNVIDHLADDFNYDEELNHSRFTAAGVIENRQETDNDDSFVVVRKRKHAPVLQSQKSPVLSDRRSSVQLSDIDSPLVPIRRARRRPEITSDVSETDSPVVKKKNTSTRVSVLNDEENEEDFTDLRTRIRADKYLCENRQEKEDDCWITKHTKKSEIEPSRRNNQKSNRRNFEESDSPVIKNKSKKNRKRVIGRQFLDEEAEVSSADDNSSDDEDGSDLDELDASFINDHTQLTQAEHLEDSVSVQAMYLRSIRSPQVERHSNRYKLKQGKGWGLSKADILSQVFEEEEAEEENEYEEDSFCVNNESDEEDNGSGIETGSECDSEEETVGILTQAERRLKSRRRGVESPVKVRKSENKKEKSSKRRRRIVQLDESCTDEEHRTITPAKNREAENRNNDRCNKSSSVYTNNDGSDIKGNNNYRTLECSKFSLDKQKSLTNNTSLETRESRQCKSDSTEISTQKFDFNSTSLYGLQRKNPLGKLTKKPTSIPQSTVAVESKSCSVASDDVPVFSLGMDELWDDDSFDDNIASTATSSPKQTYTSIAPRRPLWERCEENLRRGNSVAGNYCPGNYNSGISDMVIRAENRSYESENFGRDNNSMAESKSKNNICDRNVSSSSLCGQRPTVLAVNKGNSVNESSRHLTSVVDSTVRKSSVCLNSILVENSKSVCSKNNLNNYVAKDNIYSVNNNVNDNTMPNYFNKSKSSDFSNLGNINRTRAAEKSINTSDNRDRTIVDLIDLTDTKETLAEDNWPNEKNDAMENSATIKSFSNKSCNNKQNTNKLQNDKLSRECLQSNSSDRNSISSVLNESGGKGDVSGVARGAEVLRLLVDSRELSSAQALLSKLRFEHKVEVIVRQLSGCDYIISSRMAVERKVQSDLINGGNRAKLVKRIQEMCSLFDRPCLIIEKDAVKRNEPDIDKPLLRSRYVENTIASLCHARIKILFSDSQEDTAQLLAELCRQETTKRFCINTNINLSEAEEQVLKFYSSLPFVSYVSALCLLRNFSSVVQLINSTVADIQKKGEMSKERAERIYEYIRHTFNPHLTAIK